MKDFKIFLRVLNEKKEGIPNLTVILKNFSNGEKFGEAKTNENGEASFSGSLAGYFSVWLKKENSLEEEIFLERTFLDYRMREFIAK